MVILWQKTKIWTKKYIITEQSNGRGATVEFCLTLSNHETIKIQWRQIFTSKLTQLINSGVSLKSKKVPYQ